MKKFNKLVLLVFLWPLIEPCTAGGYAVWTFNSFGAYRINEDMVLTISNNENLVAYKLESNKNGELLNERSRASVYQKWIIVWDGSVLWFSSSDIGGVFWIKQNGEYMSVPLNEHKEFDILVPEDITKFWK